MGKQKAREVCNICPYGLTTAATDKAAYPYIRITDFDDLGNIKTDSMKFVDCDENTDKKYALKEADILFARSGSVGRTFLYNGIPPKPVFASYLIRFKLKQEIIDCQLSSTLPHSLKERQPKLTNSKQLLKNS